MDIYEYLKMDHDKVNHLFTLFEKTSSKKRQHEIVAMIFQELMVHAHSEQETFYKVLLQYPETREVSLHGEKEHQEIERQITIINNSLDKHYVNEVLKLKEIVQHHVKEEEGKIFNKAKKVISEQEAIVLKEKMHYLKGKFLLWLEKSKNESKPKIVRKKSPPAQAEKESARNSAQ
ncbi:hemerythrin domain-containing protein [Legionella dresdenensis]|uniref:Hemerythrin domain-containing protein n=1 Tax=Legionella dresdenensis TaxID=450200 RepID=A0ABV8CGJ0_9GAMM